VGEEDIEGQKTDDGQQDGDQHNDFLLGYGPPKSIRSPNKLNTLPKDALPSGPGSGERNGHSVACQSHLSRCDKVRVG
jgi:hypothetical protein